MICQNAVENVQFSLVALAQLQYLFILAIVQFSKLMHVTTQVLNTC